MSDSIGLSCGIALFRQALAEKRVRTFSKLAIQRNEKGYKYSHADASNIVYDHVIV